ncbi:MAG: phosphopantothenate/pantothenate synthetase [Methanomassiliicoccales archaeon]
MDEEEEISPAHPRYASLVTRQKLAEMAKRGVVHMTGLIAHGRGEAFDYILGEKSTIMAQHAERAAAYALLTAKHPVITVNGNVAALCADRVARIANLTGALVEINLFHRNRGRIEMIRELLIKSGVQNPITETDYEVEGIASSRRLSSTRGTGRADVILIPLEDGDRAQALRDAGKKVISIDLNPLSRTSIAASISIVDEVGRAMDAIYAFASSHPSVEEMNKFLSSYDNKQVLNDTLHFMAERLLKLAGSGK